MRPSPRDIREEVPPIGMLAARRGGGLAALRSDEVGAALQELTWLRAPLEEE